MQHACLPRPPCSFGDPPATIQLESGHRGVQLLGAALGSGSARLGPGTLPDLLQAAAFLQARAIAGRRLCGNPARLCHSSAPIPSACLPAHVTIPQVAPVLDACAGYLRGALAGARPALALRLALDLGLAGLEAALEREFTEVLALGHEWRRRRLAAC